MAKLPRQVILTEVGPRDGFQFERKWIPTELKAELIGLLVSAGLTRIQVTSFVNPGKAPQMADAEQLVGLLPKKDAVAYSGLALNLAGVERACRAGLSWIEISISASDTHSRKNSGMAFEKALDQGLAMIQLAKHHNMRLRAGIQCAFGCAYEGPVAVNRVLDIARRFIDQGIDSLAIADTTGMATPPAITDLLSALAPMAGNTLLALHLHDTRGLGLVNLMTALQQGITRFDTAFGGMGGCPFVPGAAGNIATEDTIHLLNSLGIETGVDPARVAQCSRKMESFLEKPLSGKLYRLLAPS
jgi:hydroxymethylglutaryl-CoA lyase